MDMHRRILLAAPLLALAVALPAAAQDFPNRPVRLVVPFAAGGGPDIVTRAMAEKMGDALGQRVVVENKVGAGGILAAEVTAKDAPDGYTVLLGSSTHIVQKLIQPGVKFDPLKDFAPITLTGISGAVLAVPLDSPHKTVADVVAAGKRDPGKLNYGSGGIGSLAHLAGAAFATVAKLDVVHVPYRGSVELVPALLNGSIQYAFPVSSTAVPQIEGKKVRGLAVTTAERMPQLPDVPTLREALGSDDAVLVAWTGLWAPAGTPAPVIDRLYRAARAALENQEVSAMMARVGSPVTISASPAAFGQYMNAEMDKYRRIVTAAKIKVD